MEQTDFKKWHLTDLRRFARDLGVKSPTSMTKQELLKEMEKVIKGEVSPYRSTRGRPAMKEESLQTAKEKTPDNNLPEKAPAFTISEEKIKQIKSLTNSYIDELFKILNK